ncbi:3-dehydroquinate synthase (plasmid) [Nicoliella spurrieriana]|uniref:3-dehydroquinate synthase n=1 Tax=Nicoliella spurrieriana TaxID=2925830 RepID=A0A976RQW6_9LACO|nr:3-dehydroquinate synthase [Nicoliella spurrieriana]UQS85986.1 3-dehydroquinate synthase [Nicoliella spurrieriana]
MTNINMKTTNDQYQIEIERGNLEKVGTLVKSVWQPRKIEVVTDDNVGPIYLSLVEDQLKQNGFQVHTVTVPHGEQSKSLTNLAQIETKMAHEHFNRSDAVIALGGGVVGDLAGFVAATYMRGIDLIQIPTSFLAQVDSSVGGKTAVDLADIKNIVGSFHQPNLVIIDPDTLNTLEVRDVVEGYGEVLKCSALVGGQFWQLITQLNSVADILEHAEDLIRYSVAFKAQVVMEDEKEAGNRQLLNLGHTIGHGVEALSNGKLRHGEAVSIGLVKMNQLFAPKDSHVVEQLIDRLGAVGLPVDSTLLDSPELIEKIKNDKKNHNGYLNIIYLKQIGEPVIKRVSIADLQRLLNEKS